MLKDRDVVEQMAVSPSSRAKGQILVPKGAVMMLDEKVQAPKMGEIKLPPSKQEHAFNASLPKKKGGIKITDIGAL